MRVFKFGGASVKDAAGVKNLLRVLQFTEPEEKLIVVSAMGKTTNALEVVVQDYLEQKTYTSSLRIVADFHYRILSELFPSQQDPVFALINDYFLELENFLGYNKSENYDFVYDQIIVYGELLATTIISEYLDRQKVENNWIDARKLVRTNKNYREAGVDWEATQQQIRRQLKTSRFYITQGFIGADENNFSTSLGREGSDYSAAIFAYCLNAESVTIWKDVAGVLSADPRFFENPVLLEQISYEEAIELAFYGASVIHPKTLQPLQRKEIPLFVRSFLDLSEKGTVVRKGRHLIPEIPCFIAKKNQVLISLSSLDFSFIVEENISYIFKLFHQFQIKVSLIQNSAISFSVCIENKFNNLEKLIERLKANFRVTYNIGVSLYTIRHFDASAVKKLEQDKKIYLKQTTRETVQIVAVP